MDDWHPIETAPKTGQMILAFAPEDHEYHNIGIMIWCGKDEWIVAGTENAVTGPEKWFSFTSGKEITPTHWMPLPNPP